MKKNILTLSLIMATMIASLTSCCQNSESGCNSGDKAQIVLDNILTRASVRGFIEQPVEQEKIEKMLRAAMAAPTDRNMQPWHFVVLNTPEAMDKYFGDGERAARMKKTPLIIVICADANRMQEGEIRDIWVQDLSAATENLLLAAHALDLGAVWTTIYPLNDKIERTRERLNLPSYLTPLCAVRIGYPNPERPAQPKDKWNESKITYWK